MALFRWVLVATLTSMTTSAPAQTPELRLAHERQVAVQRDSEPRLEIGEAVLTIYDETGRPVVVE